MTDPGATVATVLRYIQRCHESRGRGPIHQKDFRSDGSVAIRILGTDSDGKTSVLARNKELEWRTAVFARAWKLNVEVILDTSIAD